MSDRMIQIDRHDGNGWQPYSLDKYMAEHPEDFFSVNNGQIVGSVPFDPCVLGTPNEDGDIFVDSGKQVTIEETGDDLYIKCSDDDGNEWYERK